MNYLLPLWFVLLLDASTASLSDCSQVSCLQQFDPFSCPDGTIYVKHATLDSCCPGCVQFRGPGDLCRGDSDVKFDARNYYTTKDPLSSDTKIEPPVTQSNDCAPGLKCNDNNICSQFSDIYTCTKQDSTETVWKPDCDVDGSFSAVQCKTNGPNPRCFCYNKVGERIFGSEWLDDAHDMHCLCSRVVDDLAKNNQHTTLHCSQNGNFERLQCDGGFCYCADPYSGQPLSSVVPSGLFKTLTCYNSTTSGNSYLRLCDSQTDALAQLLSETSQHGSEPLSLTVSNCDPDGSYAPKQCQSNQCNCMTKANELIPPFATDRYSPAEEGQNCYCARDEVIFNSLQKAFVYTCDGAGNYKTFQIINDKAYCIDSDGFPSAGPVSVKNKCDLPCVDRAQCDDNST